MRCQRIEVATDLDEFTNSWNKPFSCRCVILAACTVYLGDAVVPSLPRSIYEKKRAANQRNDDCTDESQNRPGTCDNCPVE